MPKQSKRDAKPAEELPPMRRHTMKSPPDHGAEAEKTSARSEKAKPLCLNKKSQKPKKDKKDKEKPSPPETVGKANSRKSVDGVKSGDAFTTQVNLHHHTGDAFTTQVNLQHHAGDLMLSPRR